VIRIDGTSDVESISVEHLTGTVPEGVPYIMAEQ